MGSVSRAVPIVQLTDTAFSPACPSADASLAGTCGIFLGIRPFPQHPGSRRQSLDSRSVEPQIARKSVSFSLRVRGPGAAYNSLSPELQQTSSPGHLEQQERSQGSEDSNEDVVRRLYRAVQGLASSPEPQPNAYPGRVPQPQQKSGAQTAEAVPVQSPPVTQATVLGQPKSTKPMVIDTTSDLTGGNEDGLDSPSLDPHVLARKRLAMSCASRAQCPPPLIPHSAEGFLSGWGSVHKVRPCSPVSARPHHVAAMTQQSQLPGSQCRQTHVTRPHQPVQTNTTGVDQSAAQAAPASGIVLPASSAAAASWAWRHSLPPQPTNRSVSPLRAASWSRALSTATRGLDAAGVTPGIPIPTANLKATSPPTARTIYTAPTPTAAAASMPATATAERAPVPPHGPTRCPEVREASSHPDEKPEDATFEQVHLLLASLNLPGISMRLGPPHMLSESEDKAHGGPPLQTPADSASLTLPTKAPKEQTPEILATDPVPVLEPQAAAQKSCNGSLKVAVASVQDVSFLTETSGQPVVCLSQAESAPPGVELDRSQWPFDRTLAARSPGPLSTGGPSQELFPQALRPACRAWLRSIGKIAAQQRQMELPDLRELMQQLNETRLERRHAEAYLLGTRLGISRTRLARLHELAAASGAAPTVTLALLSQLEGRLRVKLSLKALQRNATVRLRILDLLQSRHEAGGPLVVAAWQCWCRAAATRLSMRGRVDSMIAARQRLRMGCVLSTWRARAIRGTELRRLERHLRGRLVPRRAAQCLFAWRAACQRAAILRHLLAARRVTRTRLQFMAWRDSARHLAQLRQLRRTAERHYRLRLLLASLAHWRFLHVSRAVARMWESALVRRRGLQLLARAMRVWHFYARRCRQLIRQLAGQHSAAVSGMEQVVTESELPAPLRLGAVPVIIQRLLLTARTFMLAMSDELLHLRSFLRFTNQDVWVRPQVDAVAVTRAHANAPALRLLPTARSDSSETVGIPLTEIQDMAAISDQEFEGGCHTGGSQKGAAAQPAKRVRASPRLLISGQWRHKRQVLVLLSQLRQVEQMAADVDTQLESAERDGRIMRLGLQQQADEIQHRTAASQEAMAAARAQQQALQADLEQLNKEALAIGAYLDRCHEASVAAVEELRSAEAQLAEAEAQHRKVQVAVMEAQAREASLRQCHMEKQEAAEAAARLLPHPTFARAQEAERQGRERLLVSQRRLSEALQLKAALMAHWRETQVAASSAPRYATQRHAQRVSEAQQQVVEAAKVVSLAELEIQDLLTAVERLTQATHDAKGADEELQAAASAAGARAAEAADRTAEAARETAKAAAAEHHVHSMILPLHVRVQQLREAQVAEPPGTPTQGQSALLEPLRVREEQLKVELESCSTRAEAAHRDLQAARLAAAELSQQVEAAEVSYRAQLLRLQPAQAKLRRSAQQLRSRLEAFPSELVRQLQPVVEEHGVEASHDASCHWQVKNLPREWARALRPGLLLADAASDTDSSLGPSLRNDGSSASTDACGGRGGSISLHLSLAAHSSPRSARSDDAFTGFQLRSSSCTRSSTAATAPAAVVRHGGAVAVHPNHRQPVCSTADTARSALLQQQETQQQQLHQLSIKLQRMSAAQLSRLARSVLGSAANQSFEVPPGQSPVRTSLRSDALTVTAEAGPLGDGSGAGNRLGASYYESEAGVGNSAVPRFTSLDLLTSAPKATGGKCWSEQQLPQRTDGTGAWISASGEHLSIGTPRFLPRGAAISPETHRLISLLERALGPELDAARSFRANSSTGPLASGGLGDNETAAAAEPESTTVPLGAHGELSGHRPEPYLHDQQRQAPQLPLNKRPTEFGEVGCQAWPDRTRAISSTDGVETLAAEGRRASSNDGSVPGDERERIGALLQPPAEGSAPARESVERAAGRSCSASSIYAHFSNPPSFPAKEASFCNQLGVFNPKHLHQPQLRGQAIEDKLSGSAVVFAVSTRGVYLDPSAIASVRTGSTVPPELDDPLTRAFSNKAWWFHRGRLCHRVFQGLRKYATRLGCLVDRLQRIASKMCLRWALIDWRSAILTAQALADSEARVAACRRYLRRLRSYAHEQRRRVVLLEIGQQLSRHRKLRACLMWWRLWRDDQLAKRRFAATAHAHQLRKLLLRWYRGAQISQERRTRIDAAENFHGKVVCRRCLDQWLDVLRARQLLRRVLATAEKLWDEYPEPFSHFGGDFDTLRHAFNHLLCYRAYRLDKRIQRINQEAAVVFRSSLLRVRVFAAWQAAVVLAGCERYLSRLAARLLRAWRLLAHKQRESPNSLCSLRRRLRGRGFAGGEADVRRRWLLRCALRGLILKAEKPHAHYTRTLTLRALNSWRLAVAETAGMVEMYRCRSLLRRWQAIAASCADLRRAYAALVAHRYRRLLRTSFTAWVLFLKDVRVKDYLISAAALHYEGSICFRVLRCLLTYVRSIRSSWSQAIFHYTHRQLRCCWTEWRAHALQTRAKRDALMRTLMSVDVHSQQACDQIRGRQAPFSAVTAGVLPLGGQSVRHRANCVVTEAPSKPYVEAVPTHEPAVSRNDTPDAWCRMGELHVSKGRVAQVLILEQHTKTKAGSLGGDGAVAHDMLHTCNDGLQPWGSCLSATEPSDIISPSPLRHPDTSKSGSCSTSPSHIALQDLPSDVSSMDAATLHMWRSYAQSQLAEEWWRRQMLRRSFMHWKCYTARSFFLKRWKLRKARSKGLH